MTLNRDLKIGDLLTVTTILISLVTVLVSWNIDRDLKITKDANEIRSAAAKALGEIERWEVISQSIHANAQATFVEAAEIVAADDSNGTHAKSAIQARDLVWKRLNELYAANSKRIVDERIDGGYLGLLSYFPDVRQMYLQTLIGLNAANLDMQRELLARVEASILSFQRSEGNVQSAEIGNALRAISNEVKLKYSDIFKKERRVSYEFLLEKIKARDDDLLAMAKATKQR